MDDVPVVAATAGLMFYAIIIGISTFFKPSLSLFSLPTPAEVAGSADAAVYYVFSL